MFPVFSLSCIQDKLLVGGGGGSTKAGVKNTLKLYNSESEIIMFFQQDAVMAANCHPFVKVIVAGIGPFVKFYNVKSEFEYLQTIEINLKSEYEFIKKLIFNSDGSLLLVLVSDGSWAIYEWPSYELLHSEINNVENFDASFINDSSDFMIVTTETVTIFSRAKNFNKIWEIKNLHLSYLKENCDFRGARVINDKLYIILNSKSRKASYLGIYVMLENTWKYSSVIKLSNKPMTAYAVNKSMELIAFGCSDLSIYIFRLDNLKCIKRLREAHGFPVTCLDFNSDSTILASGSADGTIKLSEIPTDYQSYFWILILLIIMVFAILISHGDMPDL